MKVGSQHHALVTLCRGRRPATHRIWATWATGSVWTGAENLAPTRIRSLECPACSELQYQLSYPKLPTQQHSIIIIISDDL